MKKFSSILIVAKAENSAAVELANKISNWCADKDISSHLFTTNRSDFNQALYFTKAAADAVIVLGGDGTFIGIARKLVGTDIPVLGINFGKVGFLTELSADNWEEDLTSLIENKFSIIKRMALKWQVTRDKVNTFTGYAVNDAVIGRGNLSRVIDLNLSILEEENETNIGLIRSDGLIVSTPLGSSAYNLAVGGPLVHHNLEAITLTAIAPFMCSLPPMLLGSSNTIKVIPAKKSFGPGIYLTIDGQDGFALEYEDIITVKAVKQGLKTLCKNPTNYLESLQSRGFIKA